MSEPEGVLTSEADSGRMSSLAVSSPGGGCEGQAVSGSGSTLKPYLRRKKSSLGETKVAVLGMSGVGKSGEWRGGTGSGQCVCVWEVLETVSVCVLGGAGSGQCVLGGGGSGGKR